MMMERSAFSIRRSAGRRRTASSAAPLAVALAVLAAGCLCVPACVGSRAGDALASKPAGAGVALAFVDVNVVPMDGERVLEKLTKGFHTAGGRLLAGTDAMNPSVVPGFSLHDELPASYAARR
jgi:anaerobic glycerol-3-phosphate dehydrogenase